MGAKNIGRLWTEFLTTGEKLDLASGGALKLLPVVDDQGKLQIGDGTNDMDVEIYLGTSTEYAKFDVGSSNLQLTVPISSNSAIVTTGAVNAATLKATTSLTVPAISLTGAITPSGSGYSAFKTSAVSTETVTLNATHMGGLVTLSHANAVTVTLPTPAAGNNGQWAQLMRTANQNTVVNCVTAAKIVALNTVAANTVTASTANQKIGASLLVVSNGTKWHAAALQGTWAAA